MTESSQEGATIGLARRWIPFLWITPSMAGAAVVFVTDQAALPLALWIAITLGPMTVLQTNGGEGRSRWWGVPPTEGIAEKRVDNSAHWRCP